MWCFFSYVVADANDTIHDAVITGEKLLVKHGQLHEMQVNLSVLSTNIYTDLHETTVRVQESLVKQEELLSSQAALHSRMAAVSTLQDEMNMNVHTGLELQYSLLYQQQNMSAMVSELHEESMHVCLCEMGCLFMYLHRNCSNCMHSQ